MVETTLFNITKYQRKHLKPNVNYNTWASLQGYANELSTRSINSVDDLDLWFEQMNELNVIIDEQEAWNYIRFVQQTDNENLKEQKNRFTKDILENHQLVKGKLSKKLLASPFLPDLLERRPEMRFMIKEMQVEQRTFSEKNATVESQLTKLADEFNSLVAATTIEIDGEEMSLIQAREKLKNPDRSAREKVYLSIKERRHADLPKLHDIFDQMVQLRHTMASNAGYANYRDYMWDKRKKMYYSPEQMEQFSRSVQDYLMPVYRDVLEKRQAYLGLDTLKEWDLKVELGQGQATPFFENDKQLLEKVKGIYDEIHPDFSAIVSLLDERKLLDLERRKNKAMQLFSYPLSESKLAFVFLNIPNSAWGVSVVFHETIHAIHNFYNHPKDIPELKSPATEASELFTMAMEMIFMDYFGHFLDDEQSIIRAKIGKLESCLHQLRVPVMCDRFQHWAYLNPKHSQAERSAYWKKLSDEFNIGVEPVDSWSYPNLVFIAPFYMIEYSLAQLGAIAIYKNYRNNPKQTIENMIAAMKLGNTESLQDIFKTAGINFDFSEAYITEIATFLREEYEQVFSQLK